jgi:chromosome partitioning protein
LVPLLREHLDTPPNDEAIIYRAASVADEVIVPLAPTSLDVGRLVTTIKTVADIERMRGRPLASVLLTRWSARFNISREVHDLLKERKMPLLDARIRQLTRYTEFTTPSYLEEYEAVLSELEVI